VFFASKLAKPGELDMLFAYTNRACQCKTPDSSFARLEFWKAFDLCVALAPPKEVLKRLIKVPKSFLRRSFRHFIHPGNTALLNSRLLESIQLSVKIDS